MSKVEQRTTGAGALFVGRTTIRTDALKPLVDAVRGLEESLDRAVRRAEDARAKKAEQQQELCERITGDRPARTLRQKLLGADHPRPPQNLRERLLGVDHDDD